jgi:hypothetical protein
MIHVFKQSTSQHGSELFMLSVDMGAFYGFWKKVWCVGLRLDFVQRGRCLG